MRYKLEIALFLMITIYFSLAAQAAEVVYGDFPVVQEAGSCRTIETVREGQLNAICVDQGQIYWLEGGELWLADAELNRQEKRHEFDRELCGFCVSDGECYYAYVEDGCTRFARLTADGREEPLFDVRTERTMFRMLVAREKVFVLWEYSSYELQVLKECDTCRLAIYAMDGKPLPTPIEDAYDMAFSDHHGVVFVDTGAEPGLSAMDPATGDWKPLHIDSMFVNVASVPNSEMLFARNYWGIFRYPQSQADQDGGWAEWKEFWADTILVSTESELISYRQHGDMDVHTWALEAEEAQSSEGLTLVNVPDSADSPRMRMALEQFHRLHPGVEVRFQNMTQEQLNTALLANDGSVDILSLSSADAMEFVSSGAVFDIDADDELRAQQEALVGGEAFCWDGVRYGVADDIFVGCLFENASLAQYAPELDWSTCSWQEVLSAAEAFQADFNGDGSPDVYFLCDSWRFPAWYGQYKASFDSPKDVNFDTERFRALAEQYRRCVRAGAILNSGDEDADPERALYVVGKLYGLNGVPFLPLPTIDGERPVPADAFALAVSRGTRHVDWAMDFLKCFASEGVQRGSEQGVGLCADSSIYAAYADMTEAERRNLEAQKAYVGQSKAEWYHLEYNQFAGDQFEKYFADEITLDELVSGLQQKLQMVLWG